MCAKIVSLQHGHGLELLITFRTFPTDNLDLDRVLVSDARHVGPGLETFWMTVTHHQRDTRQRSCSGWFSSLDNALDASLEQRFPTLLLLLVSHYVNSAKPKKSVSTSVFDSLRV